MRVPAAPFLHSPLVWTAREPESLEEWYQRWWDPSFRPCPWGFREGRVSVQTRPAPHCGAWYALPAAIPATARWALVVLDFRPGRIQYATTRAAADSMLERLPLADHPHVRVIPVNPRHPDGLERWLDTHGVWPTPHAILTPRVGTRPLGKETL